MYSLSDQRQTNWFIIESRVSTITHMSGIYYSKKITQHTILVRGVLTLLILGNDELLVLVIFSSALLFSISPTSAQCSCL